MKLLLKKEFLLLIKLTTQNKMILNLKMKLKLRILAHSDSLELHLDLKPKFENTQNRLLTSTIHMEKDKFKKFKNEASTYLKEDRSKTFLKGNLMN